MANEHARDFGVLRAERDADADLARALRHRVRDHAVDAGHAEQQRHRAGNRQHDERKRRPRERRVVNLLQRPHGRERQIRIH